MVPYLPTKHLVHTNSKTPPVHCIGVSGRTASVQHFGSCPTNRGRDITAEPCIHTHLASLWCTYTTCISSTWVLVFIQQANSYIVCYFYHRICTHTHVGLSASDWCDWDAGVDNTRYIEVGQVDMPTRVQQHVGWLDISMDDTVLSEILQGKAELCYVESDTRHSESALLFQVIADITTCEWCVDVCIKWNFQTKPQSKYPTTLPNSQWDFFSIFLQSWLFLMWFHYHSLPSQPCTQLTINWFLAKFLTTIYGQQRDGWI